MQLNRPHDSEHRHDVTIVGAGLAGSSLAIRLARAGMRVALLDSSEFPRDKLCGEYLSPEGRLALERLGLTGSLERLGYQAIRTVRLTTPRGRVVEADVAETGGCPGIGLSRNRLDALLVQHARDAGAVVYEGTRVGDLIMEEGRIVGVKARDRRRGQFELRAPVVVAANGRNSALVHRSGVARTRGRSRAHLFGMKCHLASPESPPTTPDGCVSLHLVPGGYAGVCRVEGSLANLCGLLPYPVLRAHRGDLDRVAANHLTKNPELLPILEASRRVGDWKTVARVEVTTHSPRYPGILYVGDSQGTVDPLGGQGMTMALQGAELLVPFIKDALARGCAEPNLQRRYGAAWHRRFAARIRLCRAFHLVMVRPGLVDAVSSSRSFASQLLRTCYELTRGAPV